MSEPIGGGNDATRLSSVSVRDASASSRFNPVLTPEEGEAEYPAVGALLKGRFRLEEELGRGGMGIVYKALDFRREEARDRDPYVAVKILNPELIGDPQFLIALQRECKRSQNLPHPNIITVFDFDRDGRNIFMTMEYLEGRPLKQVVQERRTGVTLAEAWPWIKGMGEALAFAHSNGIVHSDFKPGNVYLSKNGVKVLDFGLASLVTKNQDHDRTLVDARALGAYTPCYASLETLREEPADPADDLYAFACTIYELLTGKHPYHRLTALQAKDAGLRPKRVGGLNNRQWRALEQALALHRTERNKTSVSALCAELDPNRQVNRSALIAGVASVAVLVAGGIWLFWPATEDTNRRASREPVPTQTPVVAPRVPAEPLAPPPAPPETQPVAAVEPVVEPPPPPPPPVQEPPRIAASLLSKLGSAQVVSSDGSLAIGTDRDSFRVGDKLQFRFVLAKPMHVYVAYINSAGETSQLYPNPVQKEAEAAAGKLHWVPPKSGSTFVLRVAEPVGRDRIVALASAGEIENFTEVAGREAGPGEARAELAVEVRR
jgi:serine/threonine protein kinase